MTPGALVGALFGVLFAIRALRRGARAGPSAPIWPALWWFIAMPASFSCMLLALSQPSPFSVVGSLVCAAAWLGLPLAHRLYAPLGWSRKAYGSALVGAMPFYRDPGAQASLAAARACLAQRHRRGDVPEGALMRIEERLRASRAPLTGSGAAALAFVALARGEQERGRELLASVAGFAPAASRGPVRSIAARWLAADAASRGDWSALVGLADLLPMRLTRWTRGAAERFLDATPTNRRLWWLWLKSPARYATWPLLRMALRHRPTVAARADVPLMARHAATMRDGGADDATLIALARAWEAEEVPPEARRMIAADLEALGASRPHLAAKHAAFRQTASFDDPLSELEVAVHALHRRHDDARDLPAVDEWTEYVMLRELYRRAAVDQVQRRLAYQAAHLVIGNHAVHLLNKRGERAMAHAMFSWLLSESEAVGDQGFIAHYTRNANVSR